MIRNLMFLFIFLAPLALSAQERSKSTEQFVNEIDKKIPQLLHDFTVSLGQPSRSLKMVKLFYRRAMGFLILKKEVKVNTKDRF